MYWNWRGEKGEPSLALAWLGGLVQYSYAVAAVAAVAAAASVFLSLTVFVRSDVASACSREFLQVKQLQDQQHLHRFECHPEQS